MGKVTRGVESGGVGMVSPEVEAGVPMAEGEHRVHT